MRGKIFLILLTFVIFSMAFVPNSNKNLTKLLTKYNWESNKYAYSLTIGDTLRLTRTNSKGDLKFKKNGNFKGWEIYGVCGNISKLEKIFIKNPKWEKQGEWELVGQNKIMMDLGGSYDILMLELRIQKKEYFEFIVREKNVRKEE